MKLYLEGKMINIMIVEDDANQRKLMSSALEQYGYNVFQACDGIDALDQLDKKHVDLIILDIINWRFSTLIEIGKYCNNDKEAKQCES